MPYFISFFNGAYNSLPAIYGRVLSMSFETAKRLANHYSEGGAGTDVDLRNSALVALILRKIKGNRILDIGCGNGFLLGELAKQGREVFGVEPNPKLAILLRKCYPTIPIAEGTVETLEHLTFSTESTNQAPQRFDTITLLDVLEHVADDAAALQILYRKLVPGGRCILVVPAHQSLYGKRDQAVGHYRRYSKKELLLKIKNAGFIPHEVRHWNALAFLPYWFAEKILHRELTVSYRADSGVQGIKKLLRKMISWWLTSIEHETSFGFGLSIILVALRPRD